MKKSFYSKKRYTKFFKFGIAAHIGISSLILLLCLFSCAQKTKQQIISSHQTQQTVSINPANLPPPIKAKYIDPDSIAAPVVVPLKGKPKVVPAHPNVHPIGKPKVVQIPKKLNTLTIGKDIPLPTKIQVKKSIIPALEQQPIPALTARARDAAIYNIRYLSDSEGFPGGSKSLLEDSRGHLWISGLKGITRYDGEHFFRHTATEGFADGATTMMEDSQGNFWLGGRGLVARFNNAKEEIVFAYQVDPIEKDWVEYLVEDNKNLWFGTATSFTQVKNNGKVIVNNFPRLTLGKGLPKTRIADVLIDNNQNLWMAGLDDGIAVLNKGLDNFGKLDIPWRYYQKADGLKSRDYGNSFLDSKNRLWWTSLNGITQLDLNTFNLPVQAPENLNLSHIELQGQFLDYRNLSDSLYQTTMAFGKTASQSFDSLTPFYNYPKKLKLPYDLNHLTFHFSAIDWSAPHEIKYSFLMEGVDKIWSPPNAKAEADYRNLPYDPD